MSNANREIVRDLQGEIQGLKAQLKDVWTKQMAEDVDAALDALKDVLSGDLRAEDAKVIVERRLLAASWAACREAEEGADKLLKTMGTALVRVIIVAITNGV
jgi:hypothetical protein